MGRDDPFAGIRLSEQTSETRLDQRLFAPEKPPPSTPEKPEPAAGIVPNARSAAVAKPQASRSAPKTKEVTAPARSRFDLTEEPFYKASFLFTQHELEALEDLKLELGRRYDTKVTKNGLIRCALHLLLEDHVANGERGYASRKVRRR